MHLTTYLDAAPRGETTRMARAIGCQIPDLSAWYSGKKPIPLKWAPIIEAYTKGAVMRWDLFPDVWHIQWPELRRRKDAPAIPVTPAEA